MLKNQRIALRVSLDEHQTIKHHSEIAGLTLSAYARKSLMKQPIKAKPSEEYFELRRDIAGLCNNVNQIAHSVNSGIKSPSDAAEEARQIAGRIYALVKRMAN